MIPAGDLSGYWKILKSSTMERFIDCWCVWPIWLAEICCAHKKMINVVQLSRIRDIPYANILLYHSLTSSFCPEDKWKSFWEKWWTDDALCATNKYYNCHKNSLASGRISNVICFVSLMKMQHKIGKNVSFGVNKFWNGEVEAWKRLKF